MMNLLAKHVESLPANILDQKNQAVHLLRQWDHAYFSKLDPIILENLKQDAEIKRSWAAAMSPEALFEEATNGIHQLPAPDLQVIRLIPQYHLHPTNSSNHYKHMIVCFYACDAVPARSEVPHPALQRLLNSLGSEDDEK